MACVPALYRRSELLDALQRDAECRSAPRRLSPEITRCAPSARLNLCLSSCARDQIALTRFMANLVSASLEDACLAKADMEFVLMASVALRGACLGEADMSGAQLDAAEFSGADLRRANPYFIPPQVLLRGEAVAG